MIIYQITNKITNDVYVGKTSQNFKKRINAHKSIAKRGKGSFLHKAIRKYGIENFSFQVLEENIVDEITLNKREIFYIKSIQPRYNLTLGGDGMSGYKQTKEHIEKRVSSYKGKPLSEETKRKLSLAKKGCVSNRKGVKLSQETRQRMSIAHTKIKSAI